MYALIVLFYLPSVMISYGTPPVDQNDMFHALTVQLPEVYQSERECNLAANRIGMRRHPSISVDDIGTNFKCIWIGQQS